MRRTGHVLGMDAESLDHVGEAHRRSGSPVVYVFLVVAGVAVALAAFSVPAYRDRAFICENTGSRMGHRQWIFGLRTGYWYVMSPLEEFMRSEDPYALVHRWTSYAGTGKNIFGRHLSFGHGRPGAILQLDHVVLKSWMQHHARETIRELYDLFASDDQERIREKVMQIEDEFSEQGK